MNDRVVWIARVIGIIVLLVLIFLMMSLHARLVKLNQEGGPMPATSRGLDCELRIANCETKDGPTLERGHLPVRA